MEDISLIEKGEKAEKFSLIDEYNLHRIKNKQKYPICWAYALVDMITDTFQIYRIEELKKKSEPSSKRKKVSVSSYSSTIVNMSEIEYIYISSLIWIVSYRNSLDSKDIFKPFLKGVQLYKIIDFLLDKKIPVLGEECYPFEETLYKILYSVNVTHNQNVDGPDYKEMAKNNLKYPLFGEMNELKDGDIFYRNRCKQKIYNNELIMPTNNDNLSFITISDYKYFNHLLYQKKGYISIPTKIIGIPNPYKLNSDELLKLQQVIKKLISCEKKIIITGIQLIDSIFDSIKKHILSGNKFIPVYKLFTILINKYKEIGIDIENITYDENNINKSLVYFHTVLIYGWIKNKADNREYWIIRDSHFPDDEYYLPFANITDDYLVGLELGHIYTINVTPSDE